MVLVGGGCPAGGNGVDGGAGEAGMVEKFLKELWTKIDI